MSHPWNKNHTKNTHPSVKKISETMKKRGIDNFASWREKQKVTGKFTQKRSLVKDGNLAELYGIYLGDGSIYLFERTEYLRVACNSNNPEWIKRVHNLIEDVFDKKPSVKKRKKSNCVDVTLYQKDICNRLGVTAGAKIHKKFSIPKWILRKEDFVIRYLRGLYETDGCLCVHEPTYTHKFIFTNRNKSLLNQVYYMWKDIGFHPHRSEDAIQISRKEEVRRASKLIKFRSY